MNQTGRAPGLPWFMVRSTSMSSHMLMRGRCLSRNSGGLVMNNHPSRCRAHSTAVQFALASSLRGNSFSALLTLLRVAIIPPRCGPASG